MQQYLKRIAGSKWFNATMLTLIIATSVFVGLETYPQMAPYIVAFKSIEWLVLAIFVVEQLIRIGAEGLRPWRYFEDPWNAYDFTIVVFCFVPAMGAYATVLRLARVLRVFRLIKALPNLRVVASALLNGLGSAGYVGVLLFLHFYAYAVLGVRMFGHAVPEYFGNLQTAYLTLFGTLTLEQWISTMDVVRETHPCVAPLFFVTFIVVGTIVILNLLVGVFVNSMQEAQTDDAIRREQQASADGTPTGPLEYLRRIEQELSHLRETLEDLQEARKPGT